MTDYKPDLCLVNGDWTATAVLPADVSDVDAGLAEAGWRPFWTLGDPAGDLGLEVWSRPREDGGDEYLLEVSNVNSVSPYLLVGGFPELMDLVARWAPALQAAAVAGLVRELSDNDLSPYGLVELIAGRAAYGVAEGLPILRHDEDTARRQAQEARRRAGRGDQPGGPPAGQP